MEFNIHDVKVVENLNDVKHVNAYLKAGWVLLDATNCKGFEESYISYIVGHTSENPPIPEINL